MAAKASEQSAGHILELPDGWKVSFNTDTTSGPLAKEVGTDKKPVGFPGVSKPGMYRLRMHVYAYQTDKPLPFGIYAGHVWAYPQILELRKVLEAPPGKPAILEAEVYLRTGRDSDGPSDDGIRLIPFGLGVPVPKNTLASKCKGPGLAVQWVEVTAADAPSPGDRLLFGDMPPAYRAAFASPNVTAKGTKLPSKEIEAVARKTLARVGARLFRRDLTDAELAALMANFNRKVAAGAPLKTALFDELAGLMTAARFPLRDRATGQTVRLRPGRAAVVLPLELGPRRRTARTRPPRQAHRRQGAARADRAIAEGPAIASDSSKTSSINGSGCGASTTPRPTRTFIPSTTTCLKFSSVMETQATFRRMLDKNLSRARLRRPAMGDDQFAPGEALRLPRRGRDSSFAKCRSPADSPFGGIWTQAATMKVTANGTLTSPVKRGVWVAERLLGTPIPPPPPNIDPVDPDTRGAKTLREQLALHRSKGSCEACHAKFDPYGFALESFDVMGSFRTNYRSRQHQGKSKWKDGLPVDCTGATPDGIAFAGVKELREIWPGTPTDSPAASPGICSPTPPAPQPATINRNRPDREVGQKENMACVRSCMAWSRARCSGRSERGDGEPGGVEPPEENHSGSDSISRARNEGPRSEHDLVPYRLLQTIGGQSYPGRLHRRIGRSRLLHHR